MLGFRSIPGVLLVLAVLLVASVQGVLASDAVSYHSATVDGLNIFYREAGPKDGPTILLLHGLPSSSRMYQKLLESSLARRYHLIAPDYPGFGQSSWPEPKDYAYTFDHLASTIEHFCTQLQLQKYTLFMQDYGGPVGFRLALTRPDKVQAMVIQNAVSHEEGLSKLWEVRRKFWVDRPANEESVRKNLLSLEATRARHLGSDPRPDRYDPDLWTDEYYFLNRPGQADIQLDLFYDYQNNVKSYPKWQEWLRQNKPPLLVLWGKYDPSFMVAGAEAYKRDVPTAEVHILDAGHFVMDVDAEDVIRLTEGFLSKHSGI